MKRFLYVLGILLVAAAGAFADNTMFAKKDGLLYVLWPNADASSELGRVKVDLGSDRLEEGDTIVLSGYTSDENHRKARFRIACGDGGFESKDFVFGNIADGLVSPNEERMVVDAAKAGANSITLAVTDDSEAALLISDFKVKKYIKVPKILSAEPASGSELEGFRKGDVLAFNTNFDDECEAFQLTFTDNASPADELYKEWAFKKEGRWLFTFYKDIDMYEGHTYTVTAQGYESPSVYSEKVYGELTLSYIGKAAVPFSDVEITGFGPSAIHSLDANVITLTFAAAATIEKAEAVSIDGTKTAITAIKASEDADNKKWEIVIPEQVLEESLKGFNLLVYATDTEGKKIVNTAGRNSGCISLDIECSIPHDFTVLPDSKTPYLSLSEFTFEYKDGIRLADPSALPTLSGKDKGFGGKMVEEEGRLKFVLDDEITTPGEYTLDIPEGMFVLGPGYTSKETKLTYTVYKEKADYNVDITPADGSTVSELGSFELVFKDYYNAAVVNNYTAHAKLYDEDGTLICKSSAEAIDGTNKVVITLAQTIRTEGTYTLKVPASCFLLKGDDLLYFYGSEEMEFTFTVEPLAIDYEDPTIMPANGSTVGSLESVNIRFEQESPTVGSTAFSVSAVEDAPEMTVYEITSDGAKKDTVATEIKATIGKLSGAGRVNMHLIFSEKITKKGTYAVTLPKNSLYIKYNNGEEMLYGKDLHFEYTIDPSMEEDAVRPIFAEESEAVRLFNMQGQTVTVGAPSQAFDGQKGLYILNGKKIVIK